MGGESKECVLSAYSYLFEHGTPALNLKKAGFFFLIEFQGLLVQEQDQ